MTSTKLHTAAIIPKKSAPASQASMPASEGLLARRPAIGLALFILGGLIFGALAFNVRTHGPLLAWDLPIDQALHARAIHDILPGLYAMRFSGAIGREIAAGIMILLGLYWFWKHQWRKFSMLVIGVGGGNIWFEVLSNLIGRHRPIWPDPLDPLPGSGFPSGHSMTTMLLYGMILYLLLPRLTSWRWRLLAVIDASLIILLVGYSRLYMGAHFPTDVLGGYSFGLAWGALVFTSVELYTHRRAIRLTKKAGRGPHHDTPFSTWKGLREKN